jgi:glycosyltransferase involved in cell wall biosynthesis
MKLKPLVSIIMPAFNAGKTINESISSVINQSYKNWELIVVNDGSKDNTSEIVKKFKNENILLIEQINKGVSNARNVGIHNSKGEYIAFLDADDLWEISKLEKSILAFELTLCDLVYSKIKIFKNIINDASSFVYRELVVEKDDYYRLLIYDYIPTLTVVIKKSILEKIGYFDELLNGTEDWDLWIRITKEYKINFVQEELAYYRNHENGLSKKSDTQLLEEFKVIKKHVLSNITLPKSVKNKSLWVWNKKNFFNSLKKKKYFSALKFYSLMIYLMPYSLINIKIFFKR